MSKFDSCVPSSYATAAARTIATQDALFYGVVSIAGATATVGKIVVYSGTNTTNPIFALVSLTSGGVANATVPVPVVCSGGINITCTGTAYNHVVLFTLL
jgi:hypothetical protein